MSWRDLVAEKREAIDARNKLIISDPIEGRPAEQQKWLALRNQWIAESRLDGVDELALERFNRTDRRRIMRKQRPLKPKGVAGC